MPLQSATKIFRDYFRGLPRTLCLAAGAGTLCTALFLALNLWFANAGTDTRRSVVAAAVGDGLLDQQTRPFLLDTGRPVPVWTHNECMILFMLIEANPDRLAKTLSPRVPGSAGSACEGLRQEAAGRPIPAGYYHRYLHGFRVLTAGLLALVPLPSLPLLLRDGLLGLVAAGCAFSLWRLRDDRSRFRHAGTSAIGLALLACWGLATFGTSISFAYGDVAVIALWLLAASVNPLDLPLRSWVLAMAALGAFLTYVEFLTGQIPLALAMLPGLMAVCLDRPDRLRQARQWTGAGLAALAMGILTTALLYQIALAAVFGPATIFDFIGQIKDHAANPNVEAFNPHEQEALGRFGISVDSLVGSPLGRASLLLIKFVSSSHVIGMGSRAAGCALMGLGLVVLAWRLAGLLRSAAPLARGRGELLLVSLLMLAGWYGVMANHAIQHSFYMVRPMAWVPAAAVVALLVPTRSGTS